MIVRRLAIRLSLAACVAIPAAAGAQSKTGTTFGQFLLIEPSARLAGMGNAGAAVSGGLEAAWYNPAAIGLLERRELAFTHSAWVADITYDYAAGALPMGRWGSAWASVTALNSGDIEVRTVTQPLGTGERYSVSNVALALGYGKEITDRFSAGGQVTWLQETIWHSSASTFTLGVGTLYRVSPNGLSIGASLQNFGTDAAYAGRDLRILVDENPDTNGDNSTLPGERLTDPFSVPVRFRVGLGMPVRTGPDTRMRFAVEAQHPSDNTESVSLGLEWAWKEVLALRGGWQDLFQQDSEVGPTFGAGLGGRFDVARYHVDYGWAHHGRLGATHRFGMGVSF